MANWVRAFCGRCDAERLMARDEDGVPVCAACSRPLASARPEPLRIPGSPQAALTAEQERAVLAMDAAGYTRLGIALELGLSDRQVNRVLENRQSAPVSPELAGDPLGGTSAGVEAATPELRSRAGAAAH